MLEESTLVEMSGSASRFDKGEGLHAVVLYSSEARAGWGFHPASIEVILRFEMRI